MAITTMGWHGVSFRELPTPVLNLLIARSGLNVPIGSAPVHLVDDFERFVNRPILCTSFKDCVDYLGYSPNWAAFTLCEHMDSAFRKFGVSPVCYINVLNPALPAHRTPLVATTLDLVDGTVNTNNNRIIVRNLVVREPGATPAVEYERDVDYVLSFAEDLSVIITRISTGAIPDDDSEIEIVGFVINPAGVTAAHIIGGIDVNTGAETGIEVVEQVFPQTGLIPGILLAPGFSSNPEVAAVLATKAEDINGCFKCRCAIDVDDSITSVIDVLPWKVANNMMDPRQDVCFLYPGLGDLRYHFSSQWGPLQMHTDATKGGGVPYWSPSNKPLKCNGTYLADGTELKLSIFQANNLNRSGVVTALNWSIYGWKSWGNRTAAGGGASSDYKDIWIPQKRMNDWIGNIFVLTLQDRVDWPGNRRLIDLVVNSFNNWLAGLAASGALLGGRVEFRHEDNPREDLLDGVYRFHIFSLTPSPAEWIEGLLEVDQSYLSTLFEGETAELAVA
jgi:phage tail sheath protein FI